MEIFTTFSKKALPNFETYLNRLFLDYFDDQRQILKDAMKYSLLNGGKRVRPQLLLASHNIFSENEHEIYPVAAAIEMIHCYSLIHDDLPSMDNDDYRRGQLTCHKKFGEDIAILTGDCLNSFAFEIILEKCIVDPNKKLKLLSYFAKCLGIAGLVGGQVLDIKSNSQITSLDHLKKLHQMKTGALIEFSITAPAILAGIETKKLNVLKKAGHHIGLLFQIVDDILDVVGDSKTLGKTAQKDVSQNKLTYISLLGLDGARKEAKNESQQAFDALSQFGDDQTTILKSFIEYILTRTF